MRTCWTAACVHPLVGLGGGWGQNVTKHYTTYNGNKTPIQKKSTWWRFRYGFRKWDADKKWNKLAQILIVESWVKISVCNSEGFSGHCRNPEEHRKTERWLLLDRVWQKGPGPKPTPNKQIYSQTSQGLNSQDPELLSGINQMSGPRWHVGGWDPGWTERSRCGWGEPSDTEERGEGDPHQNSFLDIWFPGTPERDHSRLSKGEGGLVCSQPYALLQLQQVWTHEPTLQGCCKVYGLWKR